MFSVLVFHCANFGHARRRADCLDTRSIAHRETARINAVQLLAGPHVRRAEQVQGTAARIGLVVTVNLRIAGGDGSQAPKRTVLPVGDSFSADLAASLVGMRDAERFAGSFIAFDGPRAMAVTVPALLLCPAMKRLFNSPELPSLFGREAQRANALNQVCRAFGHGVYFFDRAELPARIPSVN